MPHYKPNSAAIFASPFSPTAINTDLFDSALPSSQMATELADEARLESNPLQDNQPGAEDDDQRDDYSRLWQEISPQLDELRRLADEELGIPGQEADDLEVFGGQHGHIPDDWVALPNEVSWDAVWLERVTWNNNESEDESSSVLESDERDTRAWLDRHRRWWHPPRYVIFCATRSNDRTG